MSKNPKMTPWFPVDVKPVHLGEYEYQYVPHIFLKPSPFRVLWNGRSFMIKDGSRMTGRYIFMELGDHWRGLAEKP